MSTHTEAFMNAEAEAQAEHDAEQKALPTFTTIVYGEGMDTAVMNAIAIQKAFGLTHIVPEWDGLASTLERGALHLTLEKPAMTREAMEAVCGYNLRVIPVATAKEMVAIDGGTWK